MADTRATFAIDLKTNTPQVAASSAAELRKLQQSIQGDTAELRKLTAAFRALNQGTSVNVATAKQFQQRIQATKDSIASSQARFLALGGNFRSAGKDAAGSAERIKKWLGEVRGSGGPLGSMAGRLEGISGAMLGSAAAGVALAAALVAVGVATIKTTADLVAYGIAQADARRDELLRLEGLTKIRNYWLGFAGVQGLAADKASFLQSTIDQVSGSVAIARDKVAGYAAELYRAGLRGGNLQAALEGVTTVAATQGETQAAAWKGWAIGAAYAGQSVKALAGDVKARLGGIARAQMLSLTTQTTKLRENLSLLFSGVKIQGFLESLATVTELFSQATTTGRALKQMVEAIFPSVGASAGEASIVVKRFFQGMVIGALYATIGIIKLRNWVRDTFGNVSLFKGWTAQMVAVKLGVAAFVLLAATVAGALVVTGLLGAALAGVAATLGIVLAAVGGVATAVGGALLGAFAGVALKIHSLIDAARGVIAWWQKTDFALLGLSICNGIIEGVKSGTGAVISAMRNMARGGWDAFKHAMGIASPSKVGRMGGRDIAKGVELGEKDGTPAVHAAAEAMAPPIPTAPDGSGNSGGRNAAAGPVSFTFGDIIVQGMPQGASLEEMRAAIRQEMERQLEGVAIMLGARRRVTV